MATIIFYSLSDYNNGVLHSKEFDLTDYDSYDDFSEARSEWLAELSEQLDDGEVREEFIVADYEDIPREYVGEWDVSRDLWDYLEALDNVDKEILEAGIALDIPLDKIDEAYYGSFDSDEDLAYDYVESTGMFANVPETVQTYFDYERFGHDLSMDYLQYGTHYFHSNW